MSSNAQSEPKLPWYAIAVHTRGEAVVRTLLEQKNYEIFLPVTTQRRRYSDRLQKVEVPLFPGYLFCRLDINHRQPVLMTSRVDHIVGIGKQPQPVEESQVENIRRVVESGILAKPWPYLPAGTKVRIKHGPLTGIEGSFVSTKGADHLVLSVDLLQRSVAVEIEEAWVEPPQGTGVSLCLRNP